MNVGLIYLLIASLLLLLSAVKDIQKTKEALKVTGKIALTVLPVLFFIFTLMGIISAFLSREIIASWLGSRSGVLGILIGELAGSIALMVPAAVFPFAGILLNRGASYGAMYGFIMTAILIGVTTLPVEIKIFGKKFTIVRNVLTFVLLFFMGLIFLATF